MSRLVRLPWLAAFLAACIGFPAGEGVARADHGFGSELNLGEEDLRRLPFRPWQDDSGLSDDCLVDPWAQGAESSNRQMLGGAPSEDEPIPLGRTTFGGPASGLDDEPVHPSPRSDRAAARRNDSKQADDASQWDSDGLVWPWN